ncbi:hypothetical protein TraAM80_02049 [Trypanosoma rangeli]|uniref:Uncharacterized protein n=1 Tax=Trypanosoma rangeli TaxID=5698 RepID=A0A422NW11_TRYRA|nr:uncharacterized protein TraAM80_02049 [Trypanosoma rangeli]RNF09693.1 hypothetical protein TraAM80_02049 [Trypanosoma rangeli]|eukprot:RNF09693.1 hypothetical protein TraAM80_02049 [Trypanosoma rangeli]
MADRSESLGISPIPVESNDDEDDDGYSSGQFRLIARRMSRALLRHPQLALFSSNPHAMYEALHEFFAQWSARQQRASSLSITVGQVTKLLQYGESTIRRVSLAGSVLARAHTAAELIAASPLITMEALKQELQGLGVRAGMLPLAEIVELARVIDDAQGLATPFGALNLVHVVSLSAALCPAPDMGTLLLTVSTSLHHRLLCAAVFYEWALIDVSNSNALRELSRRVEEAPSDDAIGDVVRSLLKGSFEGLGSQSTDPAVTDTHAEVIASSPDAVASSAPCVCPQRNGETSPATPHDDGNDAGESDAEEIDGGVTDTVDVEFWRRLCN